MLAALCGVAVCAASLAHAGEVDLNLSDDAVRLGYATGLRARGLELDLSALHVDDDAGDADVGAVGLHAVGPGGGARVGVGARLVYADVGDTDGGALALGGHARYSPTRWLTVGGRVHFAPRSVSFGDFDKFVEYAVRAGFRVHERADVYAGYRRVRIELEGGSTVTVDSGVHFGLRIEF